MMKLASSVMSSMETKEIHLNQDESDKLASIDATIQSKSTTAISLQLQADAMKNQVRDIYEFRKKLLDSKLSSEEMDLSRVAQVNVVPDGNLAKLIVVLRPENAPVT